MSEDKMKAPVRLNTRVSADTNEWLDRRAYEMGLTKSGLINVAVEAYRKEVEAVRSMSSVADVVKQLEQLGIKVPK